MVKSTNWKKKSQRQWLFPDFYFSIFAIQIHVFWTSMMQFDCIVKEMEIKSDLLGNRKNIKNEEGFRLHWFFNWQKNYCLKKFLFFLVRISIKSQMWQHNLLRNSSDNSFILNECIQWGMQSKLNHPFKNPHFLEICVNVEWQLVPIFRLFGSDFNKCQKSIVHTDGQPVRSATVRMDVSKKFLR